MYQLTSNIQQLDTSLTRPAECCVTWAAFIGRYSQVTSWTALWLVYTSGPRHVNRGQASMAVDAQWLALVKCFCHALDRSGYNRRVLWNVVRSSAVQKFTSGSWFSACVGCLTAKISQKFLQEIDFYRGSGFSACFHCDRDTIVAYV